tara:strand:+ start:583 stop:1173 length:591 start_codon:yes stop_codon:yes gene_type:complete
MYLISKNKIKEFVFSKFLLIFVVLFFSVNSLFAEDLNIIAKPLSNYIEKLNKPIKPQDFSYLLSRCSGFFFGASNAFHQISADKKSNVKEKNKILFGPKQGKSVEFKKIGDLFFNVLLELYLKEKNINISNKKEIKLFTKKMEIEINKFNVEYSILMLDNVKINNDPIKNNQFLSDDAYICTGLLGQIEDSHIYNK